MKCKCGSFEWKTLETRKDAENYDQACVVRRRQCIECGTRIWTIEQILREIVRPEPKARKPKVIAREPKPQKAKDRMKKRVSAMMELESRRDGKSSWDDFFSADNDYLNKY